MDILGDRKFVEIPGDKRHELPPLLVRATAEVKRLDKVMGMAEELVEQEDMLSSLPVEPDGRHTVEFDRCRMDLALNLVDQYLAFVSHWQWGDAILEWIRQCETTFGTRLELRNVLRNDLWPHAGRSSFVTLLADKSVQTDGVPLEKAVGMRLTFRQPPPLKCFSNQFLLYLNSTVASSAYQTWSALSQSPISALPPERFHFDVIHTNVF
jgi:hypothetical protein